MKEELQTKQFSPNRADAGNACADRYVRVRTDYYKIVEKPMTDGTRQQQLIKWKYAFIKADHGREYAEEVPCYDDFITFPDNINPQQVVDGKFWNLYHPIKFKPEPGEYPNIDRLMAHIFGEQKELGYDYLQQLYTNPQQKLPIIVLVSRERNTGKSTFMHFLHLWFGDNVTFNTNEDFGSQFNADWAGMLLICVDEALLSKREYSERIKNLSTARFYKIEAKGKDKIQQEFFAKFVFCSNNVDKPLIIDPGETRYWVREVPKLESDDVNFLSKVKREIPHLMYHLLNEREMSVGNKGRMCFDPAILFTPALQRIMMNSRSQVEAAIYDLCDDILASTGEEKLSFVSGDLRLMLTDKGIKTDDASIRHVVKDLWRLKPHATPSTYMRYTYGAGVYGSYTTQSAKGRYFTVTQNLLHEISENCRFVDKGTEQAEQQDVDSSTEDDKVPF